MLGRRRFAGALAPALRRVEGVRLIVGEQATRAEVYGIGHRYPVTLRVSVGLATRLVEAGAPLTIRIESATPSEVDAPHGDWAGSSPAAIDLAD